MERAKTRTSLLSEEVYDYLKKRVLNGSIPPAVWLRESEIAAQLNVSRTPVREAIRRLAQEGLVEASPNRGVRIRETTLQEVLDAYEVRANIEALAARLASERASLAELEAIGSLVERMSQNPNDSKLQLELDIQFHQAIANASHNGTLIDHVSSLSDRMLRVRRLTHSRHAAGGVLVQVEQHRAIAEALNARDSQRAEALMASHIQGFIQSQLPWLMSVANLST